MNERSHGVLEPLLDRVLIVEQRPALMGSFAAVLAEHAKIVHSVDSAVSACGMLAPFQPDLVLLDVAVPGALDVLRSMQRLDPLPLAVAVRATGEPEEAFRLAQLGVRAHLERPVTAASLEAALDRALLHPLNLIAA